MSAAKAHPPADPTATEESFPVKMPSRISCRLVLGVTLLGLLVPATNAASAQAASPWWNLNISSDPAIIPSGGEGVLAIRATNVGNASTSTPATLTATLPAGASIQSASFFSFGHIGGEVDLAIPGACQVAAATASCSSEEPEAKGEERKGLAPYEFIEMRVQVKDEGAEPGATFGVEASGGGGAPLRRSRALPIGEAAPAFGAEAYELQPEAEGGAVDARAGGHPYQLTSAFNLNQTANLARPPAMARNLAFALPPGQIGDVAALPQCSSLDFSSRLKDEINNCPPQSAIGVAVVSIDEPRQIRHYTAPVPLFNLTPAYGEPARFGFEELGVPVVLDTSLRSGPGQDYGVTVSTRDTTELANFISSTVTFWGTPGDPSHDSSRGWGCLADRFWGTNGHNEPPYLPCEPSSQEKPPAFLTLPTDCNAPFLTTASGESWTDPALHPIAATFGPFSYSLEDGAGHLQPLTACNQVPFAPHVHSEPSSNAATSPTGMSFDINFEDEGLTSSKPGARAQSQIKKALVTLPQGFTANPSVAEGLKACTEAEYEAATLEAGSGCTQESKVGEVTVQSPLVQPGQIVRGGLYVAQQGANPNHNLLTLYLIAREPEIGVLIRQALKVTPDPVTGQLTTEVDNVPELPFSHFHLFFRPGQRSPLITPAACGTYAVKALAYPWARPNDPVEEHSSFQITSGPEGQGCPSGGLPPFHPNLEAGTLNNRAGSYSPFYAHITRRDSEQEITHFSIKLPPGVVGKLAGVQQCSDAQIAVAESREEKKRVEEGLAETLGGGAEEEANPSCPAASEVGHTLVGTGVGNVLAYAPGKLYLAGPYHGSSLSIVSITAAKVGPFDLGTVVVREALKVNPETAEVFVDATGSDPIPHIVAGIPVHLRDIRIYVNRPEFVLNPTSCEKTSTASTVLGSGLNFASEADDVPVTVTSPFQAADCAALTFAPKLKLALRGGSKRGGHPALKATLHMNGVGEAAISRAQVTLPRSEFLDQGHIRTVCTRVQFKEGAGNGSNCPAGSVYGYARAVTPILAEPLEGPVFLRSSEHQLPDLVAALRGNEISVDLDGRIDSLHGQIRNTFETVPDAPVTSFTLEMQGGSKGLLINSTNLCTGAHRAIVNFTAHNGKVHDSTPAVGAKCSSRKHKHKGRHHKRRARHRAIH